MSHSIICPTHGPLVPLQRHAHNLARFFIFDNPYDESPISSWFQLASGIEKVDYVSDLFDDSVMFCGPAIEYENEKSKFHSLLIKHLTIFSFLWGGLEAYLDTLQLPNCPHQRGKINSASYLLMSSYDTKYQPLKYYDDVVAYLRKLIGYNPWYEDVNKLFAPKVCAGPSALGLSVVYKIRNLFAHGAFHFSEPDGWNTTKPYDVQIVNASSRIILLTLQMLILTAHDNLTFPVRELHDSEDDDSIVAEAFLAELHTKDSNWS